MLYLSSTLLLLLLLFAGCSRSPTAHNGYLVQDQYVIHIPKEAAVPVKISFTSHVQSRYILPFHYFDNPVVALSGPLVKDLTITDSNGNPVDTLSQAVVIGPIENSVVSVPEGTSYPITLTYSLDLSVNEKNIADKSFPKVFRNDSALFLMGSFCLILPEISTSLVPLWRSHYRSKVIIDHPAALPIYGIPADTFSCSTIYELLFLQFSHSKNIVCQGSGGGVDFVMVDLLDKPWPQTVSDSVATLFSAVLNSIASYYGPFTLNSNTIQPYTVAIHSMWGACEGTFGFASREVTEGTDGRFGEILAHEALHHFIGIQCGEQDDPWWKEAAAAYLGLETAVSLGLYSKESFQKRITSRFYAADSLPFKRSLSDPWLRNNMFTEVLYTLAYDRGGQVMLLLDDQIRFNSNNRYSLHHATADLCRRFNRKSFSRRDLIATLEQFGAEEVDQLFSLFVDRADTVPSEELLTAAFNRIDSLAHW